MDSLEIRRVYLRHGGEVRTTARALGMTPQAVSQAVQRANVREPLTVPAAALRGLVPQDDTTRAIATYVRLCLERAGISPRV